MVLPKDLPTLWHMVTKKLSRPDNVFCTENLSDLFTICEVDYDHQPTKTDHYPIKSTIKLTHNLVPSLPAYNFRMADWDDFNKLQLPIPNKKRWWMSKVEAAKRSKNKAGSLSRQYRAIPEHPAHQPQWKPTLTWSGHSWSFLKNLASIWSAEKCQRNPSLSIHQNFFWSNMQKTDVILMIIFGASVESDRFCCFLGNIGSHLVVQNISYFILKIYILLISDAFCIYAVLGNLPYKSLRPPHSPSTKTCRQR